MSTYSSYTTYNEVISDTATLLNVCFYIFSITSAEHSLDGQRGRFATPAEPHNMGAWRVNWSPAKQGELERAMKLTISAEAPAKDLVAAHNVLAKELGEDPVGLPWKQPKATLVKRIEELKAKVAESPEPEAREPRQPVVSETILAMAADPASSYEEIAAAVGEEHGSKTSAKSVASIICNARKKGVDIPKRVKSRKTDETE